MDAISYPERCALDKSFLQQAREASSGMTSPVNQSGARQLVGGQGCGIGVSVAFATRRGRWVTSRHGERGRGPEELGRARGGLPTCAGGDTTPILSAALTGLQLWMLRLPISCPVPPRALLPSMTSCSKELLTLALPGPPLGAFALVPVSPHLRCPQETRQDRRHLDASRVLRHVQPVKGTGFTGASHRCCMQGRNLRRA